MNSCSSGFTALSVYKKNDRVLFKIWNFVYEIQACWGLVVTGQVVTPKKKKKKKKKKKYFVESVRHKKVFCISFVFSFLPNVSFKDIRWLQFWFFNFRFLSCWITLKQLHLFSYFFHILIQIDGILQPRHKIYQSMKLYISPHFSQLLRQF